MEPARKPAAAMPSPLSIHKLLVFELHPSGYHIDRILQRGLPGLPIREMRRPICRSVRLRCSRSCTIRHTRFGQYPIGSESISHPGHSACSSAGQYSIFTRGLWRYQSSSGSKISCFIFSWTPYIISSTHISLETHVLNPSAQDPSTDPSPVTVQDTVTIQPSVEVSYVSIVCF